MKSLKILIPHNKPPYVHDLVTTQCKKICSKLEEKFDLKIIWVIFPTEETPNFKSNEPQIVDASKYHSATEILEAVNPDLVMMNGSMDFHNVSIAIASRHRMIPIVTIFFRNFLHAISTSTKKSIKARAKRGFLDPSFYFNQYFFLIRTLYRADYNLFKIIKFTLFYTKNVFFTYFPLNRVHSGDVNLCKDMGWSKQLIKSGFDKSSIFVVGDPYFDSLFMEIQKSREIQEISNKGIRILFCTSTMAAHGFCSQKEENNLIISVVNEVLRHNDFEISIKIHPSTVMREDYENNVLAKIPKPITLYQHENLVELINQHDVILTYGGTGAIHYGVSLGKPVVNLDFNVSATDNNVFLDNKIITQCKSLSNLASDIQQSKEKVISNNDIERYVEKYVGVFDGKSSDRAAAAIFDLLAKKGFLS